MILKSMKVLLLFAAVYGATISAPDEQNPVEISSKHPGLDPITQVNWPTYITENLESLKQKNGHLFLEERVKEFNKNNPCFKAKIYENSDLVEIGDVWNWEDSMLFLQCQSQLGPQCDCEKANKEESKKIARLFEEIVPEKLHNYLSNVLPLLKSNAGKANLAIKMQLFEKKYSVTIGIFHNSEEISMEEVKEWNKVYLDYKTLKCKGTVLNLREENPSMIYDIVYRCDLQNSEFNRNALKKFMNHYNLNPRSTSVLSLYDGKHSLYDIDAIEDKSNLSTYVRDGYVQGAPTLDDFIVSGKIGTITLPAEEAKEAGTILTCLQIQKRLRNRATTLITSSESFENEKNCVFTAETKFTSMELSMDPEILQKQISEIPNWRNSFPRLTLLSHLGRIQGQNPRAFLFFNCKKGDAVTVLKGNNCESTDKLILNLIYLNDAQNWKFSQVQTVHLLRRFAKGGCQQLKGDPAKFFEFIQERLQMKTLDDMIYFPHENKELLAFEDRGTFIGKIYPKSFHETKIAEDAIEEFTGVRLSNIICQEKN